MDTDPAHPKAQPCDLADSADDNSFRFTPIKAIRALPRLWERKPATPKGAAFKGGLKPRKLWKRFQTSFSNMQSLQDTTTENDAFQTAINASKDSQYARGTKRMRVGSEEAENRAEVPHAGRQFFETKWDSEAVSKKRKLPDTPFAIFDEKKQTAPLFAGSQFDGPMDNAGAGEMCGNLQDVNMDFAMTASSQPLGMPHSPPKTTVYQDEHDTQPAKSPVSPPVATVGQETEPTAEEGITATKEQPTEVVAEMAPTPTKAVRNLSQAQKGKLVRSALRSSLDGEDAELLNDFLSKAKAKRAAKATLINTQDSEMEASDKSSNSEESPDAECATPRSRRALEALDTNSPSPVKVHISPVKVEILADENSGENAVAKKDLHDDEQAPPSPACRRSTRVKAPPVEAPSARNTISLRRAKGTEFIFLQKTEAQELALATKRNTRNNRGQSVMPKYALEAMGPQSEQSDAAESDRPGRKDRKGSSNRRPRKNVSWNEGRLAEYEDEVEMPEFQQLEEGTISRNDVGGTGTSRTKHAEKKTKSSSRSSRSQVQQQETQETAADVESGPTTASAAAAAAPAPRSRRVRRVGESTMTSGTPVKTGSGRISKPPAASTSTVAAAAGGPSTPTKGRRKLVPRSPSSSMLPTPATKSSDQAFVSGIPKPKSMLDASAGCTPMPKRVRGRR